MSTRNKYDLILIGNLIVDHVYCVDDWHEQGTSNKLHYQYKSVGGVGNVIDIVKNKLKIFVEGVVGDDENGDYIEKYIKPIDSSLIVSNGQTSTALIISNLEKCERTSFVNWGVGGGNFIPTKHKSRWTHISYLDTIHELNIKEMRKTSDIISADLCLSDPSDSMVNYVMRQLQYLDYLFVSESELLPYFKPSGNIENLNISKYKLKHLVVHYKNKTCIFANNVCSEITNKYGGVKNTNVLGAGDMYCANFILYQLIQGINNDAAIDWAHKQTNHSLRNAKKV